MSHPSVTGETVVKGVYVHCVMQVTICVTSEVLMLIMTRLHSNTTITHWYVLKPAVLMFLGVLSHCSTASPRFKLPPWSIIRMQLSALSTIVSHLHTAVLHVPVL
jgi:hypothetical protein